MKIVRQTADNTVVIGVDPASARLAMVASFGSSWSASFNSSFGKSGPEACKNTRRIVDAMMTTLWLDGWPKKAVAWIEEPIVGVGARSAIVVAYTTGAVMSALASRGVKCQLVSNTSWKKDIVGSGNASKEEIAAYIEQAWPSLAAQAGENQDIKDAAGINLYGRKHLA